MPGFRRTAILALAIASLSLCGSIAGASQNEKPAPPGAAQPGQPAPDRPVPPKPQPPAQKHETAPKPPQRPQSAGERAERHFDSTLVPPPPEESSQNFYSASTYLKDYPFPQGQLHPELCVISRGDPARKVVALTFDDGPKEGPTQELLTILDEYGVKATFFYVGSQCEKYPQLVKQTAAAGHEVGNHTYDHCRLPNLTTGQKCYEIDHAQELIAYLTGVQPRFLRPPGGHRDDEVERLLVRRHMAEAMWDAALNDLETWATPRTVTNFALARIRPGSVVLAHTGSRATLAALPELITTLRRRGYTFVTLSELASGVTPRLAKCGRGEYGISNYGFKGL